MQPLSKSYIFMNFGVILIIIGAVMMGCFGLIFTKLLENLLVIDEDAAIFESYEEPPVDIYLDFYFFNLTNSDEVKNYGAKPVVEEIGPYKYLEKIVKTDFIFHDNEGTVEYNENTTYIFDAEKSVGSEQDKITTLNAVMAIMGVELFDKDKVSLIWPQIEKGMNLFDTFTIDQLLFEGWNLPLFDFDFSDLPGHHLDNTEGLNGTLYEILEDLGIDVPFLETNKFGFFYGQNMTLGGRYKVNTGAKGMDEYLYIQTFNGESHVDFWNNTYCNMINGSDGTQYPPGVPKDETLRLFTMDLCRSLYLEYERDVSLYDTVDTYHFVPPASMLESGKTNPDNKCYCTPVPGFEENEGCLPNSMLNMAPCTGGAPIILSTPHFYQGENESINSVDGMNPQKELHETFLDIEPTTGVVLSAAKRIQLNLPLKRYGNLPSFQNVPELIYPILWASENAEASEEDADDIHKGLTVPFIIAYVVLGVILLVGIGLFAFGFVTYTRVKSQKKHGELLQKK